MVSTIRNFLIGFLIEKISHFMLMYNTSNKISINDVLIGKGEPTYIIAEIGINHNGDVNLAKKLVDSAVQAGANAVKFQKRDLESLYKKEILDDPNLDSQGLEILLDVLKEVEFTESEYRQIIDYCGEKKITFLCTPWDKKSVDFLEQFNVPAYKIASADMTNLPLIQYISQTQKPIIVSTGMSTMEEVEFTVDFLKKEKDTFLLLHCNSTYPSPSELLNLSLIPELENKFNVPIGYSGHEQGIVPSITAVILGAVLIERHITLDKSMEGLDQSVSLEPEEFKKLVESIRESEKAKGKPVKKMTRGEILQREVLGKSLVCSSDIKVGDLFSELNLDVKGPSKGISPQNYFNILGKKSIREIKKGDYVLSGDLK